MIDFANAASPDRCPRAVACEHWGETFVQPPNCCSVHDPNELEHERQVNIRVREAKEKEKRTRRSAGLRGPNVTKQSHRPLDKIVMRPAVQKLLKEWRLRTWQKVPNRPPNDLPELFLSNKLLDHLCDRMHVCISFGLFQQVMLTWRYLEEHGQELYKVVERSLRSVVRMHAQLDAIEEAKKAADEAQQEKHGT
ncbi:hypothetical protein FRC12_014878 [Ceratobasidium sp. 428]|nr:hypothetical protein FRC12_014878 [Ceratobasidium sp. 428]